MIKKSRKGLTLVENIIAILLLGIVIAASVFALASARMYTTAARHHYQAAILAREKIEDIDAGGEGDAGTEDVVIDSSIGLSGTRTVAYTASEVLDVNVSWVEEMWTNLPSNEKVIMRMPSHLRKKW